MVSYNTSTEHHTSDICTVIIPKVKYAGLLKNHIYDPTNHALRQHNTKLHFIMIQHITAMVPK